jgi:hypothetical protein
VKYITFVPAGLGNSAPTGWAQADFNIRAGQGRLASYSAGGLVFCGRVESRLDPSQAGDLHSPGNYRLNAAPNKPEEIQ